VDFVPIACLFSRMCHAVCSSGSGSDSDDQGSSSQTSSSKTSGNASDVYVEVAREVIFDILLRLSSSTRPLEDSGTIPTPDSTEVAVVDHGAPSGLEVRWMASGNTACLLQNSPTICVSEVKAQVFEHAKVPVDEQRLFVSGQELQREAHLQQASQKDVMLVRSVSDPRVTDLGHFRSRLVFEGLSRSSFTVVNKVSTGINGDIFKYDWSRGHDNVSVAVKKLRNSALKDFQNSETDERSIHLNPRCRHLSNEDALTEIGVLSYLSEQPDLPLYLLRMLGVYQDNHFTWLVSEFANGGELFDVAAAGGLEEKQIRKYVWQMLQATEYLHRHDIGHRDISLENVLLKDGNVTLMDFGMAVRSHSSSGTPLRYFREVGKAFYRAPECYVPARETVGMTAPLSSNPGDIVMAQVVPNFLCEVRLPANVVPGQACVADVWGYAAAPADVFALGICMFILAFQCPAWEFAKLSNRFFAQFYNSTDNGLESLLKNWNKQVLSPQAMLVLTDMLQAPPTKRPSAASCLELPWFTEMAAKESPAISEDVVR